MIINSLDKDKQDKIYEYLDSVIDKNKELNLTRIDDKEKGIILHIEDSLSCLPEFSDSDGMFLDIGTGGGFPGVPLAIAAGRKAVLIDSVAKKAHAVEEMIENNGLSEQITVKACRSEELAAEDNVKFDTIVARAVASLPVIMELATPLLADNGKIVAMCGKTDIDYVEINRVADILGLEMISDRNFLLNNEYNRRIVCFKRINKPKIKLPRRNGMALKRPL